MSSLNISHSESFVKYSSPIHVPVHSSYLEICFTCMLANIKCYLNSDLSGVWGQKKLNSSMSATVQRVGGICENRAKEKSGLSRISAAAFSVQINFANF